MNFDTLNIADCIIPPSGGSDGSDGGDDGTVIDQRCSDAGFAASNPTICGVAAYLIVKPAVVLLCKLGSISFSVFLYQNGVETEVTDGLTFTSSDEAILAIGVHTGSATGLVAGEVIVTVARNGLTVQANVTVLAVDCGSGCECDSIHVKTSILIDDSKSTGLFFGSGYQSRLAFAKAAALAYADEIIETCEAPVAPKDSIKIWSFSDAANQISTGFLTDTVELAAEINGVVLTQSMTEIGAVLLAAVNDLIAAAADEKVIVLISDGEQTVATITETEILATAAVFKQAGGIIICIGLRASGSGYDLLSRIATGGFFLNAMAGNFQDVIDWLNYLKSILCVGICASAGDEYVNTPKMDYSDFLNWEVLQGQVNLIGSGFLDLQPGNGLYVEMSRGSNPVRMQSIDAFSLIAGREYRISFKAAGNNRLDTPGANQQLRVTVLSADGLSVIFDHTVAPAWDDAFTLFSFTFTAAYDVDVKLLFQSLGSYAIFGWHGDLLDNIKFEEVSTLTTLLDDDFNAENPVYVPPNCGQGVNYIPYGGMAGEGGEPMGGEGGGGMGGEGG